MGKPRFRPAQLCVNPRDFARAAKPLLANPSHLSQTEIAWAIFQHRAALVVLEELRASGETITDLATNIGADPAWLQRKLHGQAPADLSDVMEWALHFGVHILPVFDSKAELYGE